MRVFVSSVRRELEEERDSLAGQILALGHEPVFFEQFTAQSVPSREACLKAAETADVYILLLGTHYGTIFPETGTSPTEDEHTVAKRRGIPRVVMHKLGVTFEAEQEQFANRVESYTTGLFRGEFSTAAELLVEVTKVLREIEAAPKPLTWRTLSQPIAHIPFKLDDSLGSSSAVVLHCIPVAKNRLSSREIRNSTGGMIQAIRDCRLVSQAESLEDSFTADMAIVKTVEPSGRRRRGTGFHEVALGAFGGARLDRDCRFDAWAFLTRDSFGALVNEASLTEELSRLIRLAALLEIPFGDEIALGASLAVAGMISEGNPGELGQRSIASMLIHNPAEIATDIDDAVPATSLAAGAMEIGRELAVRLLQKFRELR